MQRVALRVEIGGRSLNADVPWTNFLSGFIADRLQGLDWSLFVDAGHITETVKALVDQGLASAGTIDHLQTFVGCDYSNAGGKAFFALDVLGIYDLPDPLGIVQLEPKVPMELAASSPNVLSVDADFSSVAEIIMSFVDLMGAFVPALGAALSLFAQGVIGMALTEGAAAVKDAAPVDESKVAGNHIVATRTIPVWNLLSAGTARLTQVLALDDGPALAGTLRLQKLIPGMVQTTVHQFTWSTPTLTCGPAGMSFVAAIRGGAFGLGLAPCRRIPGVYRAWARRSHVQPPGPGVPCDSHLCFRRPASKRSRSFEVHLARTASRFATRPSRCWPGPRSAQGKGQSSIGVSP